jgi:hypothetical protein
MLTHHANARSPTRAAASAWRRGKVHTTTTTIARASQSWFTKFLDAVTPKDASPSPSSSSSFLISDADIEAAILNATNELAVVYRLASTTKGL